MVGCDLFAFGRATRAGLCLLGLVLLAPSTASAQTRPAEAIAILEEEINSLKETVESDNLKIRQLRERLSKLEGRESSQKKLIADLRKRLNEIESLKKQLQQVEAQVKEGGGADRNTGKVEGASLGIHADVRIRPEYSQNRTDFSDSNPDQDSFWGHRVRFGATVGYDQWVKAKVTLQEARTFGATQTGSSNFGLYEAYGELQLNEWIQGLWLRGGRMELSFGNERLVGRDDFSLSGRSFDGVLVRWGRQPYVDIKAFYSKLRESTETENGDNDFFGVYISTEAIPYTVLDIYYMGQIDSLTKDIQEGDGLVSRTVDRSIHTTGGRIEFMYKGFRAEAEAVFQFGSRTNPGNYEQALEHFATAYFADLSYQIPVATQPTFGAFFAWASGDANPTDGKSVDFQPLFPTRHSFLGTMDLFAWSNIMDVGGTFELTPPLGFGFYSGVHYFMLAQPQGRLFGTGTNLTPTQSVGRNVGIEVDVALSWAPNPNLQLQAGYSIFIPSTVPEQLGLGTDLTHWTWIQARVLY